MRYRDILAQIWCVAAVAFGAGSIAHAQSDRPGDPSAVLTNNPPVALCQNVTVEADATCEAIASINNGSYDPDGDPVTITQNPAGPYPLGVTNVTLTILDDGGLSDQCQATVTVEDNTPPDVFCPTEILRLGCGDPTGPAHTGWATLTDNCDPSPVLTYEDTEVPNTPGVPLIMTIFREWIGTDMYGNILDCVQPILVYDEIPPIFTYCPSDVEVNCGDPTHPDQTGWAEGEDNCNQAPVLTFADVTTAGACPQELSITRTWYLNDQTGAEDVTCVQIISVVDDTSPDMTCPDGVTVECWTEIPPPDPGIVSATDNCDPEPVIEFVSDYQQGVCPIIVTRTYSATDACGNVATCDQIFTVQDVTDPVITDGPDNAAYGCVTGIPVPAPLEIVATDNCDSDLLVEFVSDVSNGQSCPEVITRTYRASDDCDNFAVYEQSFTIHDLTAPICTVPDDQTIFLCEPEEICFDIIVSDNCDTEPLIEIVSGLGAIVEGQWCYTPPSITGADVLIRVTDDCGNTCEDQFHLDIIVNTAPEMTVCPDVPIMLAWGDAYSFDFDASDADIEQSLTFDLTAEAPVGVTVNSQSGQLWWATTEADICAAEFGVIVLDDCGAADTCLLDICVSNEPPVITCPDDVTICHGFPYAEQVTAVDPDSGPFAFFYLLEAPPGLTLDPSTGAIEWDEPTPGIWEVCVVATDSAAVCDPCSPANADTSCYEIEVATLDIVIEKLHDQIQGQYTEVGINFMQVGTNRAIAGFDFLIQYDASALSFQKATEGEFIQDCEWEYFTYRFGSDGNCGNSACPTGILRVLALAETSGSNPSHHPSCYTNDGVAVPGPGSSLATELVALTLFVSDDRTLECQYAPIRFVWYDCGDNSMSDAHGNRLLVSNRVYDYAGESVDPPIVYWNEVTGLDNSFPTLTGVPEYRCLDGAKEMPERCANYYNGGVDIVCADSIDAVGDVNLNGIGYEIADAVMFTNYFVDGMLAFGDHVDGSVAASDANRDGLALSVADLVYLIRVIIGDADPYAKTMTGSGGKVSYEIYDGVLGLTADRLIGGLACRVEGQIRPRLLVTGFDLQYAYDGAQTRIVVVPSLESATTNSLNGECLSGIDGRIAALEAATSNGAPLQIESLPVGFHLQQNYPNPFNPTTTIGYNLSGPGRYRLEVFNVQGQLVGQIERQADRAGYHTLEWDGSNFASGIYLYRLEANGQSSTRKMLLLK